MENKTIGVAIVTSTLLTIAIAILTEGNPEYETLFGLCGPTASVLAVIGGLRLQE